MKIRAFLTLLALMATITTWAQTEPAPVFIVAGQSNTDGRAPSVDLPDYCTYNYCQWCYDDGSHFRDGAFETYRPYNWVNGGTEQFAYDAILYNYLQQAYGRTFYVVKESLGGTAIDPSCSNSNGGKFWSCNPAWYNRQEAIADGGKSLMKSLEKSFIAAQDKTLEALEGGYEVKAILWHQGESDYSASGSANYYINLRTLIHHLRNFLYEQTGDERCKTLPFIFGTVSTRSKQYNATINAAHRRIADTDKNAYLIDMVDAALLKDGLHFCSTSAERLGVGVFKQLVALGICPDVTTELEQEITADVMVNPDFELNTDGNANPSGTVCRGYPYGWEHTGELKGNSFGINNDGKVFHGDNLCWMNSSPMPTDFSLYQTIPAVKLGAGRYKVRCKLWVQNGGKTTCRLFANNHVQYFGYDYDYTTLLEEGETATYAGYNGMTTSNYTLRNMVVELDLIEGENLTLGIKSSNRMLNGTFATGSAGLFKVDEFRVYRMDRPTKIESPSASAANKAKSQAVYNMSGQRCSNGQLPAGIYVADGRKVMIK